VNGPISLIAVATGLPFGPEEKENSGVYALCTTGVWSSTGNSASANVISTIPSSGIKCSDITWQLVNETSGTVVASGKIGDGTWSGTGQTGNALTGADYLKGGCTVTVTQAGITSGYFKVRAIVGGSQIYESAWFIITTTKNDGTTPPPPPPPPPPPSTEHSYSFTIPQFNISFGILLTSNVSVTLDVPNILKGERSQIDVSATGTPVITYGVAYYANGLDVMSLDVTTLSKMLYESAVYQKEYNVTDVMELMKSMICGPGNTAFVTIPKLAVDGEYSFITFTNVDNKNIGASFTSVNVYAEPKEIPAVIINKTVNNKDIVVTYVGSGTVTVKSITITPPAPPANVKHIGIFIEIDTTGTIHEANITIKYNDSDVVDIDESKLRMYYYDETEGTWKSCNEIGTTGVDTENNIVWANVTHFTIFAPMAEKTAAGPAPGIGWLIYVGVIGAVMIIIIVSLTATVKRKKRLK
jgi:hypothetical protein